MSATRARHEPAPIFADVFALAAWITERLDARPEGLPRELCQAARRLLADITLALKGRQRELYLDDADERLVILRVQLRLAAAAGYLREEQILHALALADRVGRQLGGWKAWHANADAL